MGIKNLSKSIKKVNPDFCKREVSLATLRDKTVVIDTSLYLHRFAYATPDNYLSLFKYQVEKFRKHGINPVYIFDGEPPEEKSETLEKRKQIKKNMNDKIDSLDEKMEELIEKKKNSDDQNEKQRLKEEIKKIDEEREKLEKRTFKITHSVIKELKKVLKKLDVMYIFPEMEAEKFAVYMVNNDYAYACLTEDGDVFAYGCKRILKNFSLKSEKITLVYLEEDVLDKFKYNLAEFQDFCILCGCDYIDNIPKIGCVNAYKLINQYRSIDEIINSKKVSPPADYDYKKVRQLFSLDLDVNSLDDNTQKKLNKLKSFE